MTREEIAELAKAAKQPVLKTAAEFAMDDDTAYFMVAQHPPYARLVANARRWSSDPFAVTDDLGRSPRERAVAAVAYAIGFLREDALPVPAMMKLAERLTGPDEDRVQARNALSRDSGVGLTLLPSRARQRVAEKSRAEVLSE